MANTLTATASMASWSMMQDKGIYHSAEKSHSIDCSSVQSMPTVSCGNTLYSVPSATASTCSLPELGSNKQTALREPPFSSLLLYASLSSPSSLLAHSNSLALPTFRINPPSESDSHRACVSDHVCDKLHLAAQSTVTKLITHPGCSKLSKLVEQNVIWYTHPVAPPPKPRTAKEMTRHQFFPDLLPPQASINPTFGWLIFHTLAFHTLGCDGMEMYDNDDEWFLTLGALRKVGPTYRLTVEVDDNGEAAPDVRDCLQKRYRVQAEHLKSAKKVIDSPETVICLIAFMLVIFLPWLVAVCGLGGLEKAVMIMLQPMLR